MKSVFDSIIASYRESIFKLNIGRSCYSSRIMEQVAVEPVAKSKMLDDLERTTVLFWRSL